MAYGKGQHQDSLKRMADLGRTQNTPDLAKLRLLSLEARGLLAESIWLTSILDDLPTGRALDAAMLRTQSALKGTLNSVWAEKARLSAKSAVAEQVKRAMRTLFGRFKHLSTAGDRPMRDGTVRLVNFPEDWSSRLAEVDIAAMQTLADSMDFAGTMALFRKIEADKPVSFLNPTQTGALRAMLDTVKARFDAPRWDTEDGVVQIHLDFRCLPGGREAQDSLLFGLTEVARAGVFCATSFLISGVVARGAPIALKACVRPDVLRRLIDAAPATTAASFTSLVLEIGLTETVVKGVLAQKPAPFTLADAKHLLGHDFGMVNTSAAALVTIDQPLDAAWLGSVKDWTKSQAKDYLESHTHDGAPVDTMLVSGRNFLARINEHAEHIDRLRSEIDRIYNRLTRLKHEANKILGQPADARLDLELQPTDRRLADLLARFAKLLPVVHRLKLLRRQVYRSVAGLKKSWFGWVTTHLARTCRQHQAAFVRENLTFLAKEKASADYRGRTFNKMLNNGSKGQFTRRMTDKLQWHGVPEIVVPSSYTSSTDVRFAVVDGRQRRGEVFVSSTDGRRMHADLHAGLTLALWPLLRPREQMAQAA